MTEICKFETLDKAILDLAVENLKDDKRKLSYCPYPVDEELLRKVVYAFGNDKE